MSTEPGGRSVVAAPEPSKLVGRVRFPSPALRIKNNGEWRSLVAHPAGGRAVAGSNPVSPTSESSRRLSRNRRYAGHNLTSVVGGAEGRVRGLAARHAERQPRGLCGVVEDRVRRGPAAGLEGPEPVGSPQRP